MSRIIIIVVLCSILTVQAKFPDDSKPCNYEDKQCIVELFNKLFIDKVVQIDPLKVAKMHLKQGVENPVRFDLIFKDNALIGLSKIRFTEVKGFAKDFAQKHELSINVKNLQMLGPYIAKGTLILLPVSGTGESNVTLDNTQMQITFTGNPFEKNGETYMDISNLELTVKPGRIYYHFTNLFNGDKLLGDNVNAFLNDNWELIFRQVEESFRSALKKIIEAIIKNVFTKYPYAKFFAE
ncbi:protein takeout [Drosophila grimshawi]|uniref:GH14735 n=1 Tax=Drosophila grimshawi TaxID=7222 RepID=B4JUZ1_DROGR|nr:protein takeout [Drosophila grimshawi]EDV91311.1 GH14735 [Drosophila grimshawi]